MDDFFPTGSTTQTIAQRSAAQVAANAPAQQGTALNTDFETFLKMLTTQMKNQDPLDPLDSTQFATQLATFSSVEQQVMTNDLLTNLATQMGALGVAQISGWIGRDATAIMPVEFDGSPITLTTQAARQADSAQLVVRNASGVELQRLDIPTTRQEYDWAGLSEDGTPLASGTYDISVDSFSGDQLIASDPVAVHSRIVEVRNEGGASVLVMASGQQVASTDIKALLEG
jgi:flagellar basal-body rod modification protein FlgD